MFRFTTCQKTAACRVVRGFTRKKSDRSVVARETSDGGKNLGFGPAIRMVVVVLFQTQRK